MINWLGVLAILALLIFELRKSNKIIVLLAALMMVFMPWTRFFTDNWERNFTLALFAILWLLWRATKSKVIYFTVFVLTLFFILKFNSIIGNRILPDWERTLISDGKFFEVVHRFSDRSVFLPFRLRPLIFGNWIIIYDLIGRAVGGIWPDKFMVVTGLTAMIPIITGLIKYRSFWLWILFFTGVAAGMLSRNPDTSTIYYLLLPPIITWYSQGWMEFEKWLKK